MPTEETAAAEQTDTQNIRTRVSELQKQILMEKTELAKLRRDLPPEQIEDYTLSAHDGSSVRLSEMFGAHRDLILVHNMGKSCVYCTLWADGFIGVVPHLENRAGFVVISKDDVATQRAFYQSRGWNFKMYSSAGSTFNHDMGYEAEDGSQHPGISGFHKNDDGTIVRTATTPVGPGDDFCAVWHLLDLLKDGTNGWEPQYSY